MKRTLLLAAACGSLLLSCKSNTQPATAETAATQKTYAELEKAAWLQGSWGNSSPEGNLTESWEKANDSVYNGNTYFVIGKDTVFTEKIRLEETNGKLAYITAVSDQNGGQPIRFELISATDEQLVFGNPAHDFPQKITYKKISNDSLIAEISGLRQGKPATETFAMKKQ